VASGQIPDHGGNPFAVGIAESCQGLVQ
jgi:hypothetical protein